MAKAKKVDSYLESLEETTEVEESHPKITITLVNMQPVVEFERWEVFNSRMMQRVNRAVNRKRMQMRRQTIKEARHGEKG